jgi:hypothetical protein
MHIEHTPQQLAQPPLPQPQLLPHGQPQLGSQQSPQGHPQDASQPHEDSQPQPQPQLSHPQPPHPSQLGAVQKQEGTLQLPPQL